MIDLTDRLIQTPTLLQAPNGKAKWHPWRRALQVLCGILLVALPLTNGMRLDARRDVFYFAWHRMAAHDLYMLFWVAMLGLWSLVTVSFLYGRLWCGWVCPQTLASDFAESLRARLDRMFRVRRSSPHPLGSFSFQSLPFPKGRLGGVPPAPGTPSHSPAPNKASEQGEGRKERQRQGIGGRGAFLASRTVWATALLAMAFGTGLILACYWLAPATVWHGAMHPWADLPAAATVYGLAAVIAADMLWLRRRFCSHACPYGAMIGMVADRNTLAARYLDERDDECIHCRKCVTDCPMGVDIRKGVGQVDCIGCGECVDSCNDVLGRRGQPGLIEFRYGVAPENVTHRLPLAKRLGLWDATRGGVLAAWAACLGLVLWCLYGPSTLAVSVTNQGAITRDARGVRDTYLLNLNNGTPDTLAGSMTVLGLPGVRVEPSTPMTIPARSNISRPITLIGPASLPANTRYHVRLVLHAGRDAKTLTTIFYAP